MLLSDIVNGLEIDEIIGNLNIDIKDLAYDSRKVKPSSLFVCIDGVIQDGHKYINDAVKNGAKAILVMKNVSPIKDVTIIRIKDTRYGLAYVSNKLFKSPSKELNLIGVTGTKGKTTTTFIVKSIFDMAGKKTGLVGTIQNMIGEKVLFAERTTPESYDLQQMMREMIDKSCDTCIMEVSSQGLALDRVALCDYDIGVFTNLSADHIGPGEHSNIQEYAEAKAKLFTMCKKGLINIDSEYANMMIKNATCEIFTYGIEKEGMVIKPDFMAKDIVKSASGVKFTVCSQYGECEFESAIPGKFSVYNALAAIGVGFMSGIPADTIANALGNVKVPGRAEIVDTNTDFTVMIDYAHNPDSFINILTTVKEYAKGRVIFLFGCGGDKQRPRELMGETAGKYADFSIITSDNPRTEEPMSIIEDLEKGMLKTDGEYICIVDRKEAIKYAIDIAKAGDVIILAGKGHETYQIFKDKQIHFDEREIVQEILDNRANVQ